MKEKQHGEKQRIRGDSKCPINKDGVMVENSKWLDTYLCDPQTPASRVNPLVKHETGNQSLFPNCFFSIFFPSSGISRGHVELQRATRVLSPSQSFKDTQHYSLKSRRNWEKRLVYLAFYTHYSIFRYSFQLSISRCSCLYF